MRKIRFFQRVIILTIGLLFLISGCTSTILIDSKPSGAKVLLDNQEAGITPIKIKIKTGRKGKTHLLVLEKTGYQKLSCKFKNTKITTMNTILLAIFFTPALFYSWQPKQDSYIFTLEPSGTEVVPPEVPKSSQSSEPEESK